jgi:hypothetical protein
VVLAVSGPTEVEAPNEVSLRVSATKGGKTADDVLKDARIDWTVGQAVKNSGATWRFSPLEETVMFITVTATFRIHTGPLSGFSKGYHWQATFLTFCFKNCSTPGHGVG